MLPSCIQNVVLLTILHVNKTTKYSFQVIMELLSTEKSDLDVPVIIIYVTVIVSLKECHDMAEILLKLVLNTNQSP